MFRDNFYKVEQDWCRARGMNYMVHLNHEETMTSLVASEGSFWRDMRFVGVPGIDNLNQIRPGIVADFPKLAASAAHVFGHPRSGKRKVAALTPPVNSSSIISSSAASTT